MNEGNYPWAPCMAPAAVLHSTAGAQRRTSGESQLNTTLRNRAIAKKRVSTTALISELQRLCPFPVVLFTILSNPQYARIVSWIPEHGRAFQVHDMTAFLEGLLPLYCDVRVYPNDFTSFIRHLKLWGFRQFTKGPDTSAYFHDLFVRGMPDLLKLIEAIPDSINFDLHQPEKEPNYYARAHGLSPSPHALPPTPLPYFPLLQGSFSSESLTRSPPAVQPRRLESVARAAELDAVEGLRSLSRGSAVVKLAHTPKSSFLPLQLAPRPPTLIDTARRTNQVVGDDRSLQFLRTAKQVADSRHAPVAKDDNGGNNSGADTGYGIDSEKKRKLMELCSSPLRSKKCKWLPPLGPATTGSPAVVSSPSSVPLSEDASWYTTNPENFADAVNKDDSRP